jgi:hypothetical protein
MKQWRSDNKEKIREQGKQYREDNKEQIREYKKQYREDNKEKIHEKQKQKFNCLCGGKYTLTHKARHLKTKLHIAYLETQEQEKQNEKRQL